MSLLRTLNYFEARPLKYHIAEASLHSQDQHKNTITHNCLIDLKTFKNGSWTSRIQQLSIFLPPKLLPVFGFEVGSNTIRSIYMPYRYFTEAKMVDFPLILQVARKF
jgi:hypothetical protein